MPKYFLLEAILNLALLYTTLKSNLITIFYVLHNNFSYIQLSFVFLLHKDSYFDCNDTDAFFLFQKKILISFVCFFSKIFCFLIVLIYHFYIYRKKSFLKFSSSKFSSLEFSSSKFSWSEFCLLESEEISISSIIYLQII